MFKALSETPFRATDTGVHPKLLADWNRNGLLITEHEKNKRHDFTLSEFVWIKLIEKMREYNFSLNFVRSFREELLSYQQVNQMDLVSDPIMLQAILESLPIEYHDMARAALAQPETVKKMLNQLPFDFKKITFLDTVVCTALLLKKPISFLLDHNGQGTIFSPIMFEEDAISKEDYFEMLSQTHVSISVTEALAEILAHAPTEKISGKLQFLTDSETKILIALKEKDVASVKVRFDQIGEADLLEICKRENVDKRTRLMEMILSKGYQDITLKAANGEIVFCENTRKVKLK